MTQQVLEKPMVKASIALAGGVSIPAFIVCCVALLLVWAWIVTDDGGAGA